MTRPSLDLELGTCVHIASEYDGYVTVEGAVRDYGVVLDPRTLEIRELRRP